jgi:hypothetical protein
MVGVWPPKDMVFRRICVTLPDVLFPDGAEKLHYTTVS